MFDEKMTLLTHLDALQALRSSVDVTTQIAALKHLKTEIVGHFEKKDALVREGILEILLQILENCARSKGKRRYDGSTELQNESLQPQHWTEEDEVTLQAIILTGSLVHAGPPFVAPILSSGCLTTLLTNLSPKNSPHRLILAVLRTLNALADSAKRTLPITDNFFRSFSRAVYVPEAIQSYATILAQKSSSSVVQNQIRLLSRLLRKTCVEEQYQVDLLCGGVLDLLAARIASFYANHESSSRWGDSRNGTAFATELKPPSKQTITEIFRAANAIVQGSIYRIMRLVNSPAVKRIFSLCPPESFQNHKALADSAEYYYLPRIPQHNLAMRKSEHSHSKHFPALGSFQMRSTGETLVVPSLESPEETDRVEGYLSSLLTWLLVTIKEEDGSCRTAAASLFTTLSTSGLFGQYLDRMAAMVVIPRLIEFAFDPNPANNRPTDHKDRPGAKMEALKTLARLIEERPSFQKAALDGGVIEKTCALLKLSFEFVEVAPPAWSSNPVREQRASEVDHSRIGSIGIPEPLESAFGIREGLLILIAAMSREDDEYRKKFNEGGATQCIIESLRPLDEKSLSSTTMFEAPPRKTRLMPAEFGSPVPVLLAACGAARSLSRSVNLLRTSLIDSGLAAPIFALLKHPDVEVMKAATDVVCNLNPEFSPMRQDLVEAGAIKTLCEHARSADPEICIRSLWALKHLVHQLHNDIKQQCFDELGSGWLMQVITGEEHGARKHNSRRKPENVSLGGANAAGEKVDILNSPDENMSDTYDQTDDYDIRDGPYTHENDDQGARALFLLTQSDSAFAQIPSSSRDLLHQMKITEASRAELSSIETELSIQRQGLDFLRNFIIGPGAPDLIDTVFRTMGVEEIFDLITEKIRAHSPTDVLQAQRSLPGSEYPSQWGPTDAMSGNSQLGISSNSTPTKSHITSSGGRRSSPINPQLLHSAIMTLTHIAAGNPRQRSLLLSHTPLLILLHAHLSHPEPTIRCAVAWCVNNLTWMDDSSDVAGVIGRSRELQRLGYVEKLKAMMEDSNVDVKERVGTSLSQLETALKAGEGGSSSSNGAAGSSNSGGIGNGIRGPGIEREGSRRATREGRLT